MARRIDKLFPQQKIEVISEYLKVVKKNDDLNRYIASTSMTNYGTRTHYHFSNGYGASLVAFHGIYSSPAYEIALIRQAPNGDWMVIGRNPILDHEMTKLFKDKDEAMDFIRKIKDL